MCSVCEARCDGVWCPVGPRSAAEEPSSAVVPGGAREFRVVPILAGR